MAESKLTKKEVDELRARLTEERTELATQLSTIEEDAFSTTQSELSGDVGLDDESADAGSATFEREKDLSIEQNVRDLIQKIDRALKRIEDGTYGYCEDTAEPISLRRLEARPIATLSIEAQERHERMERTHRDD